MKKELIVWKSKNKHIVIVQRESFYNDGGMIYCILQEKRHYKFSDKFFFELKWHFVRWEDTLSKAIEYCWKNLDDVINIEDTNF